MKKATIRKGTQTAFFQLFRLKKKRTTFPIKLFDTSPSVEAHLSLCLAMFFTPLTELVTLHCTQIKCLCREFPARAREALSVGVSGLKDQNSELISEPLYELL